MAAGRIQFLRRYWPLSLWTSAHSISQYGNVLHQSEQARGKDECVSKTDSVSKMKTIVIWMVYNYIFSLQVVHTHHTEKINILKGLYEKFLNYLYKYSVNIKLF